MKPNDTQAGSPHQPSSSPEETGNLNETGPGQQMQQKQQQPQRVVNMNEGSSAPTELDAGSGSIHGAAYNASPIFDAQGSLVGLQAPMEGNVMDEMGNERVRSSMGYVSIPPVYQYNMAAQAGTNLLAGEYLPYTTYAMSPNHQAYNAAAYQQQQQQLYQAQLQQQQEERKQLLMSAAVAGSEPTVVRGFPKFAQSFDKCPTVCSLFAILCCPITLGCSLPALIYSLCSYTDYRAADAERYQHKSDMARHLVITACVVGLLLCIAWAVLAFFYYEVIIATVNDFIRVIHHRVRSGT
ncbi:unnamed protein product [Calicophoron daubneyi]|uniref:Uncharacterized protein n=1 Tax=Calicophoron daubneyi TaxID=300641 RepID=A0AAV2TN08_CALDB